MRLVLALLALVLFAPSATAYTPSASSAYALDRLPGQPPARKYHLGSTLREAHNTLVCVWDYAKTGGAAGDHLLYQTDAKTLCKLPDNSVVRNGLIDVITTLVGVGSTMAIKIQSAGDIKAATAVASFTGLMDTVPVGTAATAIKLTAERQVYATVASAFSAGKFRVFIDYVLSE